MTGQETHNHADLEILAERSYEDVESFHGFWGRLPKAPKPAH